MRNFYRCTHLWAGAFLSILILFSVALLMAGEVNPDVKSSKVGQTFGQADQISETGSADVKSRGLYNCNLKVYIVEPDSRWRDNDGENFHEAALDIPYDTIMDLAYLVPFSRTINWNPTDAGFDATSVMESNIKAIAVIFNRMEGYSRNSDPYDGLAPFTAYLPDACAAAIPGETGSNMVEGEYTHTVFLEECSTTWCPNCPAANLAISTAYATGENFEYASLISDVNSANLYDRLNEISLYYVPTVYVDGGEYVIVGGYSSPTFYLNYIRNSGRREVPDVALSVTLTYNSKGTLTIDVSAQLNTFINSTPADPSAPDGPTSGTLETDYTFTASTTDGDADQLYYMWDWGNGDYSEWLGPYNSGEDCETIYSWDTEGTYSVKVMAKDTYDAESDWSNALSITLEGYPYICGDANADQIVNVSDAVKIINYVFIGGTAPDPLESGDANCDGVVNVSDAVKVINYVFIGGYEPCDTNGDSIPDC